MTADEMYALKRAAKNAPYRSGFCSTGNPLDSHQRCPGGYDRKTLPMGWVECACDCHETPAAEVAPPTAVQPATASPLEGAEGVELTTPQSQDQTPATVPCGPGAAGQDVGEGPLGEEDLHPLNLTPGSPEWARRVSPSKAAACLGISAFDSQRSMWHKMRGEIAWDEETAAMERGNLCESAVLAWWRKHNEHTDWQEQVTMTIGDWLVATPDAIARVGDHLELIEAKTSSSLDDYWGEPGTDVIPVDYLTQVYVAMHVAHLKGIPVERANVPVLGGRRLLFYNYVVEYDAEIGADLLDRLAAFYDSLHAEVAPDLDDSVATYDAIRKLHKDIDLDRSVELTADMAEEIVGWQFKAKKSEAPLRAAKSAVLDAMGNARYATYRGVRIARRQPDGPDRTKFVVVGKPDDLIAIDCTDLEESA